MVAMVATSLKVTLGAVARHPGADVGYQGVLTGGTVAARVEAGQGHADSTPTDAAARGAPLSERAVALYACREGPHRHPIGTPPGPHCATGAPPEPTIASRPSHPLNRSPGRA